jgi:hypothetical protein
MRLMRAMRYFFAALRIIFLTSFFVVPFGYRSPASSNIVTSPSFVQRDPSFAVSRCQIVGKKI